MARNSSTTRWMRDSEANCCLACRTTFSTLVRKHHCRRCGGIFCSECTSRKMLIPREQLMPSGQQPTAFMPLQQDSSEPQRVCDACAAAVVHLQDDLRVRVAKANQETIVDRSCAERYLNLPVHFSMEQEIRKAAYILYNFTHDNAIEGADAIPRDLLRGAKGIAVLTIFKAGFFFTGRIGTGLVVAQLPDGTWSAPSAIYCTGVGWGFQVGGEITDVVIVLNTAAAVEAFASRAQVSLGTELGVSLGPVGRSAGTDLHTGGQGVTAAFSYAHSKGLFIGVSLEASIIVSRPDVNRAFYGEDVGPWKLLRGEYARPRAAEPLYAAINEVTIAGADGASKNNNNGRAGQPRPFTESSPERERQSVRNPFSDEWDRSRQSRLSRASQVSAMEELQEIKTVKSQGAIADEDEEQIQLYPQHLQQQQTVQEHGDEQDGEMQSIRF